MVPLNHLIFFACLHFILSPNILPSVANTLKQSEAIRDGQSLISQGGTFKLGFFTPSKLGFFTPSTTSNNRYLGIWYNTIPTQTVVWVANRDSPLTDTSGIFRISSTGSLVLVGNQTESIIWSSNTSKTEENLAVEFLESGNLVLRNVDSGTYLWQSFDFPGNTFLPGMKIGWSFKTGKSWHLSSWRGSDDPSSGIFTLGMEKTGNIETVMRRNQSHKYSRSGSWTRYQFSDNILRYEFTHNAAETYLTYQTLDKSLLMRLVLTEASNEGYLDYKTWAKSNSNWVSLLNIPRDRCDYYAVCGPYSICDVTTVSLCQCLDSFKPRSPQEWSRLQWTKGCEHEVPINCSKGEGFRKHSSIKLPDTEFSLVDASMNLEECRIKCLSNCACTAYATSDTGGSGTGCIMWLKDLIDMRKTTTGGQDLYIRMAASERDPEADSRTKESMILVVSIASIVVVDIIGLGGWCFCKRRRSKGCNGNDDLELPLYDLEAIKRATNNFSEENKLGKGGFGTVYKGTLEGGQKIAVKRLAKDSTQGIVEFKNEVLISKLQHRNLVRLLGCCTQGEEKMLLYEYMQNKSLDIYIFDDKNRRLLDWKKRFQITFGIARGLLYLHHDSIVRIIHRDLKASNVLLDGEMIPKISDFGLARICGGDQVEGATKRIVGTFGYMSPEYAIDGHFSIKSDVFSFGVLLLEIISGKKNRAFRHPDHNHNLLGHAWILWSQDRSMELVDVFVRYSCCVEDVMRCIHVGLLCVQKSSERRPTMSSVLSMLSSSGKLPVPQPPGFYVERSTPRTEISLYGDKKLKTSDDETITLLEGR